MQIYTFEELDVKIKEKVIVKYRSNGEYKDQYDNALADYKDYVMSDISDGVLEEYSKQYTIASWNTDKLLKAIYGDNEEKIIMYECAFRWGILGNILIINGIVDIIKSDVSRRFTEDAKELENKILEWYKEVLRKLDICIEEFEKTYFSDYVIAGYITDKNLMFTENGKEVKIND